MPDFLEAALRHHAKKKGLTGEHADKYVYGTMNNLGAMSGPNITEKGRAMEAKHERDMATAKPRVKSTMKVKRRRDLVELK
jgi:hypothetical protein